MDVADFLGFGRESAKVAGRMTVVRGCARRAVSRETAAGGSCPWDEGWVPGRDPVLRRDPIVRLDPITGHDPISSRSHILRRPGVLRRRRILQRRRPRLPLAHHAHEGGRVLGVELGAGALLYVGENALRLPRGLVRAVAAQRVAERSVRSARASAVVPRTRKASAIRTETPSSSASARHTARVRSSAMRKASLNASRRTRTSAWHRNGVGKKPAGALASPAVHGQRPRPSPRPPQPAAAAPRPRTWSDARAAAQRMGAHVQRLRGARTQRVPGRHTAQAVETAVGTARSPPPRPSFRRGRRGGRPSAAGPAAQAAATTARSLPSEAGTGAS
jgi:hypothetical protein